MILLHSVIDSNEVVMIVSVDDIHWHHLYPNDKYDVEYKRQEGDKLVLHIVKRGYKHPKIKSNPFKRIRRK